MLSKSISYRSIWRIKVLRNHFPMSNLLPGKEQVSYHDHEGSCGKRGNTPEKPTRNQPLQEVVVEEEAIPACNSYIHSARQPEIEILPKAPA